MYKFVAIGAIALSTALPVESANMNKGSSIFGGLQSKETLLAERLFTSANVDKVKEGMTLSQVEALIGKGRKESTISMAGMTGVEYRWGRMVIDRFVDIMFIDGKVSTIVRRGI